MFDRRYNSSTLTAAVLATLYPSLSLGQEDQKDSGKLETIIVTATRRELNLQEVGQSITAFSTADIERQGLQDVEDVIKALPSVSLVAYVPGRNSIFMRGISTGSAEYYTDSQISIYLDDQPLTSVSQQVDIWPIDIERIESPGFIKMDIWSGRRVAPQATAVGKALICQLSREEVQEIAALHPITPVSARTIVTLPHLLEDLAAIRRRGYAIDDEEHAVGVRCVAAPVFAASGEVAAAIGVSGTVSQVDDDYMPSLGKIVQTTALKLSAQLGGRRNR